MVAAFIVTAEDEYLDLKGCLGVINIAVEDSKTDFAAVERMRRCIPNKAKQQTKNFPVNDLISRFMQARNLSLQQRLLLKALIVSFLE